MSVQSFIPRRSRSARGAHDGLHADSEESSFVTLVWLRCGVGHDWVMWDFPEIILWKWNQLQEEAEGKGSRGQSSAEHPDAEVFLQLLQEDEGQDRVRNQADPGRN